MILIKEKVNQLVRLYKQDLPKFKTEIKKLKSSFLFGIEFYKDSLYLIRNDFVVEVTKKKLSSKGMYIRFIPDNLEILKNNDDKNILCKLPKKEIDELFEAAEEIKTSLDWGNIETNKFEYIPNVFFMNNKLIKFLEKLPKIKEIKELVNMYHFNIDELGTTWQN